MEGAGRAAFRLHGGFAGEAAGDSEQMFTLIRFRCSPYFELLASACCCCFRLDGTLTLSDRLASSCLGKGVSFGEMEKLKNHQNNANVLINILWPDLDPHLGAHFWSTTGFQKKLTIGKRVFELIVRIADEGVLAFQRQRAGLLSVGRRIAVAVVQRAIAFRADHLTLGIWTGGRKWTRKGDQLVL